MTRREKEKCMLPSSSVALAKQPQPDKVTFVLVSSRAFPAILLFMLSACASSQRGSHEVFQKAAAHQLLNVQSVCPDIEIELRYETPKNVTWQPVYPKKMPCLLYRSTMTKLQRAQSMFRAGGYRLKIFDAWRPPEVQQTLFDHGSYTNMFTDPSIMWSKHCSGVAVDVTLLDKHGRELKMPSPYDDGGSRAAAIYTGDDPEVRQNLSLLQSVMTQCGFNILDIEWWHFGDADFEDAPPPPIVYASEIGIVLPSVKKKVRRSS
jgi:D-alanyl-D-alanine dipeptidase